MDWVESYLVKKILEDFSFLIRPKFGFVSSDIDECLTETHDCPARSRCINTPGSYSCVCEEGFMTFGDRCKGNIKQVQHTTYRYYSEGDL